MLYQTSKRLSLGLLSTPPRSRWRLPVENTRPPAPEHRVRDRVTGLGAVHVPADPAPEVRAAVPMATSTVRRRFRTRAWPESKDPPGNGGRRALPHAAQSTAASSLVAASPRTFNALSSSREQPLGGEQVVRALAVQSGPRLRSSEKLASHGNGVPCARGSGQPPLPRRGWGTRGRLTVRAAASLRVRDS